MKVSKLRSKLQAGESVNIAKNFCEIESRDGDKTVIFEKLDVPIPEEIPLFVSDDKISCENEGRNSEPKKYKIKKV